MGLRLTWIAIENGEPDQVCRAFHLQRNGSFHRFPVLDRGTVTGVLLPTAWYAICFNGSCPYEDDLLAYSNSHRIIECHFVENAGGSSIIEYVGGQETWSVYHNDGGAQNAYGDPPEIYEEIRKRQLAIQESATGDDAEVDHLFEVPNEVGLALTGFRYYGGDPDLPETPYEELVELERPVSREPYHDQKKWWQVWR